MSTSDSDLEAAAELLRNGELVAFPTETVYGLGADALDPAAVDKIFLAKGRPSDNPLIVHVADRETVGRVANKITPLALKMMDRFWPGPLTMVLPKRLEVPEAVTAGLNTVAVRFPNHPVARALIQRAERPIAAPSANRSGRPSATSWQAAAEDLDGRVAAIVCGDPTVLGLESTVIDMTSKVTRILRPGGVTWESLQEVAPDILPYSASAQADNALDESNVAINSPGLRHQHYQPHAEVYLVDSETAYSELADRIQPWSHFGSKQGFFIGLHAPPAGMFQREFICCDVQDYAARLFDCFRQADAANAPYIACESVIEVGLGVALMDRLRRAATRW